MRLKDTHSRKLPQVGLGAHLAMNLNKLSGVGEWGPRCSWRGNRKQASLRDGNAAASGLVSTTAKRPPIVKNFLRVCEGGAALSPVRGGIAPLVPDGGFVAGAFIAPRRATCRDTKRSDPGALRAICRI